MSTLNILLHPHAGLRTVANPVKEVDANIRQLVNDMWETMYHDRGIGLAATQVDVHKRLLVLDVSDKGNDPRCFINPELLETHGEIAGEEGCLSIPGVYAPVVRPETIKVKFLDEAGEEKILETDGLMARCIQHEIDHLNGILFIDHLSRMKRDRALKKYFKELDLRKKNL